MNDQKLNLFLKNSLLYFTEKYKFKRSKVDKLKYNDINKNLLIAGWSSLVARQAHNLKVLGSNPSPATKIT
jgi:hypothetical protein